MIGESATGQLEWQADRIVHLVDMLQEKLLELLTIVIQYAFKHILQ